MLNMRMFMGKYHRDIEINGTIEEQYRNSGLSYNDLSSSAIQQMELAHDRKIMALHICMRSMIGDVTYLQTPIPLERIFGPCVSKESLFAPHKEMVIKKKKKAATAASKLKSPPLPSVKSNHEILAELYCSFGKIHSKQLSKPRKKSPPEGR